MELRKEVIRTVYFEEQLFTADWGRNVHVIKLSNLEKGGLYRALTSLQAFEGRLLNRWSSSYRLKYSNSNPKYSQTRLTLECLKRLGVKKVIEHKSLQDFYKYIHYNPKRGKSMRYLDSFMGVWKHAV